MGAERVKVARVELQPPARHQKRTRHPARRKAYNALAFRERFYYEISIRHDGFPGRTSHDAPAAGPLSSATLIRFKLRGPLDRLGNRRRPPRHRPVLDL